MLDQEIGRLKKSLDATQLQLDETKAEKKNLENEVTKSAVKIASLEDELVEEKLKHEHSSTDLQAQLDDERKRRKVIDERLANLRSRYQKNITNGCPMTENSGSDEIKEVVDVENKTENQLLLEVGKFLPT